MYWWCLVLPTFFVLIMLSSTPDILCTHDAENAKRIKIVEFLLGCQAAKNLRNYKTRRFMNQLPSFCLGSLDDKWWLPAHWVTQAALARQSALCVWKRWGARLWCHSRNNLTKEVFQTLDNSPVRATSTRLSTEAPSLLTDVCDPGEGHVDQQVLKNAHREYFKL